MNEDLRPDSTPRTPPKPKRGRPLLGDRRLTQPELQRRTRNKKRQAGVRHFLVGLQGDNLQFLEEIAGLAQISRVGALKFMINMGLHQIRLVLKQSREMGEAGETPEAASKAICRAMGIEQEPNGGADAN